MQEKEYNVILDLYPQDVKQRQLIEFVQGDRYKNILNLYIKKRGEALPLSGCEAAITMKRPDGIIVQCDTERYGDEDSRLSIEDRNTAKVKYVLGTTETQVAGRVQAEISIYEGTIAHGIRLTTMKFDFNVRAELFNDDAIRSSNEIRNWDLVVATSKSVDEIAEFVDTINEEIAVINDNISTKTNELWQDKAPALVGNPPTYSSVNLTDVAPHSNLRKITVYGETRVTGAGNPSPSNPHSFSDTESAQAYIYEPDKSPETINVNPATPLRSLPLGVADSMDLASGDVIRRVNKVSLASLPPTAWNHWGDGTTEENIKRDYPAFQMSWPGLNTKPSGDVRCSHLPHVPSLLVSENRNGICTPSQGNTVRIKIDKNALPAYTTTVELLAAFKTWVSTNNVTLYSEMAAPASEPGNKNNSLPAYSPNTNIAVSRGTINVLYNRDINKALANKCDLLLGTFAARPVEVVTRTLYVATDRTAGNADRLTINMGGTTWLQI